MVKDSTDNKIQDEKEKDRNHKLIEAQQQDSLADIERFISGVTDPRSLEKEKALMKQDEKERNINRNRNDQLIESSQQQDSLADIEKFISGATDPRALEKEKALMKQDEKERNINRSRNDQLIESSQQQDSLADIEKFISAATDPRALEKEKALMKQDEKERNVNRSRNDQLIESSQQQDSLADIENFISVAMDPLSLEKEKALMQQDEKDHYEGNNEREEQSQEIVDNLPSERSRAKTKPPSLPGAYRADWDGVVPTEPNRNAKANSYSLNTMRRVETFEAERSLKEKQRTISRSLEEQTQPIFDTEVSLGEGMPNIPEDDLVPETELKRSGNQITNHLSSERKTGAKNTKMRRKYIALGSVTFIIILIIVGVITGTKSTDPKQQTLSDQEASLDMMDIDQCHSSMNNNIPERYQSLRNSIISSFPNVTTPVDTPYSSARRSICWIAFTDLFRIEIPKEGQNYKLIQRFVMGLLYYRFVEEEESVPNSFRRTSWLNDQPICSWEFITCENDQIQQLCIANKQLKGGIPSELSLITSLTHLGLAGNRLSGEIPPELWSMSQLKVLRLGSNELTGRISNDLSNLFHLEELYIDLNSLSGTIPELSRLSNLKKLRIESSNLDGTIPLHLWDLTRLTYLSIGRMNLSGSIPTEIGHLTNIETLRLFNLALSGTIPTEIGKLTASTVVQLKNLALKGEIPSELGMLSNMEKLSLEIVNLTGTMPQEICSLALGRELATTLTRSQCKCCIY